MAVMMVFDYNHPSKKAAISGELSEDGIVTFAVYAASDSPIHGTELFRRMMTAFGPDAVAIQGAWFKGIGPSINIDEVNKWTATGMPLEDAILKAWTVTRATKLGFGKVKVLSFQGIPGAYSKIEVLIEK